MQTCSNCKTANPDAARFCMNCGRPLAHICPNCQTENPPAARFCINCGASLTDRSVSAAPARGGSAPPAASRESLLERFLPSSLAAKLDAARAAGTMLGERRVVTILFCDVVGSTDVSEKLDPEEWSEIINGAFEHMIGPIYRLEGTVARLMGDGILAFFGAPIAHEDDPQRAVLAGLEIIEKINHYRAQVQRQWGIEFAVRVGINTGLVVVGAVGSDLRMEYTALGDAINLAARMEQTAQVGTLQIAEETHRLVAPFFEFVDLGELGVKGKSSAVHAYQILRRVSTTSQALAPRELEVSLVGRDEELERLLGALADVQRGLGGIVCLFGEAGLGKTRLLRELHARLPTDSSQGCGWYESASFSYETEQPYGLFQRLLRRLIDSSPGDAPETLRLKIQAAGENLTGFDTAMHNLCETLFGLPVEAGSEPLSGEAFKNLLYETMLTFWGGCAARQPLILACDDLHWSDQASIDLLLHLFSLSEAAPLLFVCALRPERQSPAWAVKQKGEAELAHVYREIVLQPLNTSESQQMVAELLQRAELPSDLNARILEKAQGNPLFIEEVVRVLAEQEPTAGAGQERRATGAEDVDLEIPSSLQALLTTRIDRLEDSARRTLQLAAVIGRSFYFRVLERITSLPAQLSNEIRTLKRSELIMETARQPELEYIFRHALVQETAYQMILLRQRREYHRQVGQALLDLFPERQEELAGTLALHFFQAHDYRKAQEYFTLAGDAAYRLYGLAEAIDRYQRAVQCARLGEAPPDELNYLYTRLGRALEVNSQFADAMQVYLEMESLAQARGDRRLELAALAGRCKLYAISTPFYNPALGRELAEKALALARQIGDQNYEAQILWNLMNLYRFEYDLSEKAIQFGDQAVALARQLGQVEQEAYILNDLSEILAVKGYISRSGEAVQAASILWRQLGNLPMLADSLNSSAMVLSLTGHFAEAQVRTKEAEQISRSIGNLWGQAFGSFSGVADWLQGEYSRAIQTFTAGVEMSARAGFVLGQVMLNMFLSWLYAELGAHSQGAAAARAAIQAAGDHFLRHQLASRAALLLHSWRAGDQATVQAHLEVFDQLDQFVEWISSNLILMARLIYSLEGGSPVDEDLRRSASEQIFELRQIGAMPSLAMVLNLAGRIDFELDDLQAAAGHWGEAYQIASQLNLRSTLWQVLAAQAALARRGGDQAEAERLSEQSRQVVAQIMATLDDPALREAFNSHVTRTGY